MCGYDMRWLRRPEGVQEKVAAAREAHKEARAAREALPAEEQGKFNWDLYQLARGGPEGADRDDPRFWEGRTERYSEACAAEDAAYKAWDDADEDYFRLNISGMGQYARLMDRFGMIFEAGEYPDFPKMEDYGVTGEMYDAYTSDAIYTVEGKWIHPGDPEWVNPSDEEIARTKRYVTHHDSVPSWHPEEYTLAAEGPESAIPAHKFGTNDGWIVTPAECKGAIRQWRKACADAGAGDEELGRKALIDALDEFKFNSAYWLKWVAWIERAAEYGGFAVR